MTMQQLGDGVMKLGKAFIRLPLLVKAGIGVGMFAGACVGTMVSPPEIGVFMGIILGAIAGAAAGTAMQHDDELGSKRGRQLDDIIGVTRGSLGAPPGSIPPGDLRRDPESGLELQSWASEWLTPPPPNVR
jgi:hypothetical protein